ncbi:Uncharacterised protein [Actinobaculum suis]|uniref:Uncharacterized protein n=1 Tax=Actinobaculum suis TaxID=1657 RepID=A0A7Z8Y8R2_9ACTO|nr:hypothetical protein [Actinobaculum suis]VDG75777.1 Uncharacterised protein [Actinobaculum suis]
MDILQSVLEFITKAATIGGSMWALWGGIEFWLAQRDQNGAAKQQAIWQIIGGAMIVAMAGMFARIAL